MLVNLIKISGSKISPPAKNYLPTIIQRVQVYFHTFLKNIYIECLLKNRDLDYEKSIYSLLETLDIDEFEYPYFYFIPIQESSFMLVQDKFHELVHNPVDVYKNKASFIITIIKIVIQII